MLSLLAADPPKPGLFDALRTHWPLLAPLVLGAVAIFYLLPRPRAYPFVWGLVAGLLALLSGGILLVQAGVIWEETLLFYAFAGIAVAAGAMLVTQHNPARAALSFAVVVLATCGLFLLLAAPFLMAATIVVYAGAIVVTFLFVLMLAQQEGQGDADARSREPLLATITGFVLLGALLYTIKVGSGATEIERMKDAIVLAEPGLKDDPATLTIRLMVYLRYNDLRDRAEADGMAADPKKREESLAEIENEARRRYTSERLVSLRPAEGMRLSDLSGTRASTPRDDVRRDPKTGVPELPAENAAYLGKSLFTDYLLPVELGGFLLLVATVGAIAIGQRKTKSQTTERNA